MGEMPRRRLLDRLGSTPTLIAQHTTFAGDLTTQGALLVNGAVQGNGSIGGEVAISSGARWEGDLTAHCAVIAGTVIGDITVADKLEIGASARLRGRVSAKRIAIALGAQVEGDIACTGSEPIIQFVEKRAAVPEPH
ncbi:MAG TPA: polymer-forming cytoskeletal protein [Steroidobacteraceae bacterium]|nr:polymer-forming cytoskeletal protein [Steroidobacteraceae bacterium]